jgi:hypothetical protein
MLKIRSLTRAPLVPEPTPAPEPEPAVDEPDLEEIVERPPELEEVLDELAAVRAEKDELYEVMRSLTPHLNKTDPLSGSNRTDSAATAEVKATQRKLDEVGQRIRQLRRKRAELMAPLSQDFAKATQPKTIVLAEDAITSLENLQAGIQTLREIAVLGSGLHIGLSDQAIAPGYAMPPLMDASALDRFAVSLTKMRRYFGRMAGRME